MFKKKTLISLFLVICLSLTASVLFACETTSNLEIKFLTPKYQYRVGDNIDAFELIQRQKNVKYQFKVTSLEGETVAEFAGRTFCVSAAGIYTLTCTATLGEQSLTDSVEVNVYDRKPYINVSSSGLVFDLDEEYSLWALMALNTARILSDTEYIKVIDYITYYENDADKTGIKTVYYDSSKAMAEFDVDEYKKLAVAFDKEGIYECHMYVENGGGRMDGFFKVTVSEDLAALTELEGKTLEFDKTTLTASWAAVEGASSYKVKADGKSFYTQETSVNISDAIYKEFQYFDLVVLPLDENGEKMGTKITKSGVIVAPIGYENVVLSKGAFVDTQNSQAKLEVGACLNGDIIYWKDFSNDYISFKGDYGVGNYVEVEFVGNNLPYVCFFSNDISGNMTNYKGGKGLLLMNGICDPTGGLFYGDRMRIYGMERLAESYWDSGKYMLKSLQATEEESYSYEVSQKYLKENASAEFKYVVGTYENGLGKMVVDIELYRKGKTGDYELIWWTKEGTTINAADVEAGNILLYSNCKGLQSQTVFTFSQPYQKVISEDDRKTGVVGGKLNMDGSVTVESAPLNPDLSFDGIAAADNGHLAIIGNYGVGNYIETTFTSSTELVSGVPTDYGCDNIPQILLFADNANGKITSAGGKGILLSSGVGYWSGYTYGATTSEFAVYGPDRMVYGNEPLARLSSFPLLTQEGIKKAKQGDVYKYTVGTFYNVAGELCVHISLMIKDGDLWKELINSDGESYSNLVLNTGLTAQTVDSLGSNIVIIAENKAKVWKPTTTFSFKLPEQKEANPAKPLPETIEKISYSNAVFNDDGSITLKSSSGLDPNAGYSTIAAGGNGYIAFNGKYGVNHYVEMTFGASTEAIGGVATDFGCCNLPDVLLFADKSNGNKTTAGGKGILLTGGIGFFTDASHSNSATKYSVFGPDRVENKAETYSLTDYPLLTQNGLRSAANTNVYKYVVGTYYNRFGLLVIDVSLFVKNGDNWDDITTADGNSYTNILITTEWTAADINKLGTNVVLMSANKAQTWQSTTTFTYTQPTYLEPTIVPSKHEIVYEKGSFNKDGSVILSSCDNVAGNGIASDLAGKTNGYVAFKGNYGVNNYIEMIFGASTEAIGGVATDFGCCNLPDVILFANNINGDKSSTGGKGILITGGVGFFIDSSYGDNTSTSRLSVYGPDRMDADYGDYSVTDRPLLTQLGLRAANKNNTYKYIVGTYYDRYGYLIIDVTLLVKNGDSWDELTTEDGKSYTHVLISTEWSKTDVEKMGTNIILMAANKQQTWSSTTVFAFGDPEYKEPTITPIEHEIVKEGAILNADGSISLNSSSGMDPNSGYTPISNGGNGYFAFKGSYGTNYFLDITFTASTEAIGGVLTDFGCCNLPDVILFADSINGNKTAVGGKGILLTSGVGFYTDSSHDGSAAKFSVFGPDRLENKAAAYSLTDYPLLSQAGLRSASRTNVYRYIVGTYYDYYGKLVIDVTLLLKDGNNWVEIKTAGGKSYTNVLITTEWTAADIKKLGTNVVVMAANKAQTWSSTTTFTFENLSYKEVEVVKPAYQIETSGATTNADGTVSLASCDNVAGNGIASDLAGKSNGYVAFKGNYGVNNYIEMTFSSSTEAIGGVSTDFGCCNLPDVILFANNINGDKTSTGGKGILITGGIGFFTNACYGENTSTSRLSIYGPDRMDSDYGDYAVTDMPLLTQLGLRAAANGNTYKYIVGSYYNERGYLVIDVSLLIKNGDKWDEIKNSSGKSYTDVLITTEWTAETLKGMGGNIIIMAANKQQTWSSTTTIGYSGPEYKNNTEEA